MIDGKWPIERHVEWAATAVLYEVQQLEIINARCPHCGSEEMEWCRRSSPDGNRTQQDMGVSIHVIVRHLQLDHSRGRAQDPGPDATTVECAVCEHIWDLEICQYKKQHMHGDQWQVKWQFVRLGEGFNPLRVLARYYQRKVNQKGEEHAA